MSDVMGGSSVSDPRAEIVSIPETPGWEAHHHMAAAPAEITVRLEGGEVLKMQGLFRTYTNRPGDSPPNHPGWIEWEAFGQIKPG